MNDRQFQALCEKEREVARFVLVTNHEDAADGDDEPIEVIDCVQWRSPTTGEFCRIDLDEFLDILNETNKVPEILKRLSELRCEE